MKPQISTHSPASTATAPSRGNPSQAKRLLTGLTLALALPAVAVAGEVSLKGEGSVRYEPDSARLSFTANASHQNAKEASQSVKQKMARWREGIATYRGKLVDYNDAQVTLYNRTIEAEKDGDKPRRQAVASQRVSFSITDLSLLNPLLEQAQKIGLEYRLGGQEFFHSDVVTLEQKALAAAIADARQRCDFVARQFDQACGEVVTININGGHRPGPLMMMSADSRSSAENITSIGQQEITASVSATFKLD